MNDNRVDILDKYMKILFLLRLWPIYGGGETVTRCLANEFVNRGHEVHIVFFKYSGCGVDSFVDNRVITHCFEDVGCDENTRNDIEDCFDIGDRLCQIVNFYKIDFVINNWHPLSYIKKIKCNTSAKVIWCLHTIFIPPYEKPTNFVRWVKHTLFSKHYLKKHNENAAKKIYEVLPFVDKYVFLSQKYVDQCNSILKTDNSKLGCIPNPVPWKDSVTCDQFDDKENVVLVVGRTKEQIKRFSLVLKIWDTIESSWDVRLKSWKLVFVGDGESLTEYREMAKGFGLERVEFVGYQIPIPYYRSAKIVMMTSKFEGFPMTLLEAQQMGVVPIVMDSFPAVHDVVFDKVNGVIVPDNRVFKMSKRLRKLMVDQSRLKKMACNGMESVKAYSVENVVTKWEKLFYDMR